jgi:hypothetical protein
VAAAEKTAPGHDGGGARAAKQAAGGSQLRGKDEPAKRRAPRGQARAEPGDHLRPFTVTLPARLVRQIDMMVFARKNDDETPDPAANRSQIIQEIIERALAGHDDPAR